MSNRDEFPGVGCLISVGRGIDFKVALLFGACVRNKKEREGRERAKRAL
jgi:hypothetical protein